jgi:hypothetical protein
MHDSGQLWLKLAQWFQRWFHHQVMAIAQVSSVSHITCSFLELFLWFDTCLRFLAHLDKGIKKGNKEPIKYYLENHRSLNCNSSYILLISMTNVMDFAKTNVSFPIFDNKIFKLCRFKKKHYM